MNVDQELKTLLKKLSGNVGDRIKEVSVGKSSWLSSKLWIVLGVVCMIVFLAHGDISKILDPLWKILSVWLICRTLEDCFLHFANAWVKRTALQLMAKDQLTAEEWTAVEDKPAA